jgi:hypothetical protein
VLTRYYLRGTRYRVRVEEAYLAGDALIIHATGLDVRDKWNLRGSRGDYAPAIGAEGTLVYEAGSPTDGHWRFEEQSS